MNILVHTHTALQRGLITDFEKICVCCENIDDGVLENAIGSLNTAVIEGIRSKTGHISKLQGRPRAYMIMI